MSDEGFFLPFVVTASKGGPYDDAAYTAGWEMGVLDHLLAARPYVLTVTVHAGNMPQIDLLAMAHGYTVTATVIDQTWTAIVLERSGS